VTKYEYGGLLDGVPLSILLKSVIDPLKHTTTVSYNRQGERIRLGDPNGTTHHYRYDLLGRLDADRVDPGPGVAADTTEITYEYTESGLLEFVRSFGSSANRRRALNRVRRTYNRFGQLTSEIQLHSEAEFEQNLQVHVSYGYEVGAVDAGSVQHAPRRTTLAYPHGGPLDKHARFAVVYGYNDEFSSEAINRVASVGQGILKPVDDPVLSGAEARATTVLARYTPFGAGDVYRVTYPPTGDVLVRGNPLAFDVNGGFLPRSAATGEYDRSRDTSYRALDPFDRILELNWGQREYGFPERLSYWRSRLGHPLARRSRATVPWSMTERNVPLSQAHDERYQYDELDRLRQMERGTLPGNYTRDARTPALSATNFEQSWRLDQQDNWTRFAEDSDGEEPGELVQRRQHDLSNRIEQVMPSGQNAQPRYDPNGNMTRVPQMPGMGQPLDCQYDGWNRLVRICRDGQTIVEYEYDGLGRRTVKRRQAFGILPAEVRHYYYSDDWQVLQERVGTGGDVDPTRLPIDRQYVWGIRGLDDLILRDRDASQPTNGILSERLYALTDANGNIVSLYNVPHRPGVGLAQRVIERIGYAPYGQAHFMDKDFAPRTATAHDWNILFGGYYYDPETGLYHVRNRFYDPNLGRFLQIDSTGFRDSYNLYQYARSSPVMYIDPTGRVVIIGGILIGAAIGALLAAASYSLTTETEEFDYGELAIYAAGGAAAGALGGLAFFGAASSLAAIGVTATYTSVAAGVASGATGGFFGGFVTQGGLTLYHGATIEQAASVGFSAGLREGAIGALGGAVGGAFLGRFGAGGWSTLASGAGGGFASGAVSGALESHAAGGSFAETLRAAASQGALGGALGAGFASGGRLAGLAVGRVRRLPEQPNGLDPRITRTGRFMIGTRTVNNSAYPGPRSRILRFLIRHGVLAGRVRQWAREYDLGGLIAHHQKPTSLGGADILRNIDLIDPFVHRQPHPVSVRPGVIYF
jgi:RHS repeat-associated protein